MTDATNPAVKSIAEDAEATVDRFIFKHHAAAIPALLGACVMWAVENGGTELIKGSLGRAIALADEMQAIKEKGAQ